MEYELYNNLLYFSILSFEAFSTNALKNKGSTNFSFLSIYSNVNWAFSDLSIKITPISILKSFKFVGFSKFCKIDSVNIISLLF